MFKKIAAILALAALLAYSAVNYPYPQRRNYGNGTINAVNSTADADLKARFKSFYNNFYAENGSQARIKFDEPENTVSEGIGYAMIMMVYFSDAAKSYQSEFDKLWAYYKAHLNDNGVMHWKISGFGNAIEQNGATDAELDVALALAMAYYQFGDTKYKTDAESLIGKIWTHEMNSDGLHKPGDKWDNDKNPSYVSPAAFEIFKDWGNSTNWSSAVTKNYTFLKANQNTTSGLPSNWADASGSPKNCTYCGYESLNYGQDAVRAPWRWAWSKAWFGHSDAETLLAKLATWVNGKTPGDIKGPIGLSGTMGTVPNAGYLGSLMCALTHKSDYQSKLNTYWASLATISGDTYFNSAMQILTGLLVTGNMPNLKVCTATGGCGTIMPPPGDYSGAYTQLDKLAFAGGESVEARGYAVTGEPWFAYTDAKAGYENGSPANGQAQSSITNQTFKAKDENDNCKEIDSYRVVIQDGSDWAVKIQNYTLNQGTYKYDPFVALGLDARNNGKSASAGGYDLSKCASGFSYEYKGSAHKFKVLNKKIADGVGSDHFKLIGEEKAVANAWTNVVIPPAELAQPSWVTSASSTAFSLADVRGWAWELPGDTKSGSSTTTGHSPMTGSLSIKNFRCLGDMPLPPAKGTSACGTDTGGGGSSSSKAGSSSSTGGGASSSSIGGGNSSSSTGGGSSSSDGTDPIISLSQHVANNGVFAIKNGVNLQVSKNASMEVFGLNGKSLRKHEFSNGSYSVMLGDLPKGLYIVKVQFGNQREILRVPVR
jgi:endo-1,4-beta-D-glucanase Y